MKLLTASLLASFAIASAAALAAQAPGPGQGQMWTRHQLYAANELNHYRMFEQTTHMTLLNQGNFIISSGQKGEKHSHPMELKAGVDHLGFQVDSDEELRALRSQVAVAQIAAVDQPGAECCYARSDKYWITDPQGVAWETYHTLGEAEIFGADSRHAPGTEACCTPRPVAVTGMPAKSSTGKCR